MGGGELALQRRSIQRHQAGRCRVKPFPLDRVFQDLHLLAKGGGDPPGGGAGHRSAEVVHGIEPFHRVGHESPHSGSHAGLDDRIARVEERRQVARQDGGIPSLVREGAEHRPRRGADRFQKRPGMAAPVALAAAGPIGQQEHQRAVQLHPAMQQQLMARVGGDESRAWVGAVGNHHALTVPTAEAPP